MTQTAPPATLTAYHDDGTRCEHGLLQVVQRGLDPAWCAGGRLLSRLEITPADPGDPP